MQELHCYATNPQVRSRSANLCCIFLCHEIFKVSFDTKLNVLILIADVFFLKEIFD